MHTNAWKQSEIVACVNVFLRAFMTFACVLRAFSCVLRAVECGCMRLCAVACVCIKMCAVVCVMRAY